MNTSIHQLTDFKCNVVKDSKSYIRIALSNAKNRLANIEHDIDQTKQLLEEQPSSQVLMSRFYDLKKVHKIQTASIEQFNLTLGRD